jgi:hypothetical protein
MPTSHLLSAKKAINVYLHNFYQCCEIHLIFRLTDTADHFPVVKPVGASSLVLFEYHADG